MGRRCTGRGCRICFPEQIGQRQRMAAALREREQRDDWRAIMAITRNAKTGEVAIHV